MRVQRIDRGEVLKKPETTPEGYLRLDGKIARTGVQIYRRSDGTEYREYRPPDEVFSKKYLDGFAAIPLTDTHPARLLNDRTAVRAAVGAVASARKMDDTWVGASFTIWDKGAMDSVGGGRSQLSVGYSCEVQHAPGISPDGEHYDGVQKSLIPNHLALVDEARAGSGAAARLDDAGNVIDDAGVFGMPDGNRLSSKPEPMPTNEVMPKMPHKMKIDGLDVEVADTNAQAIIERAIAVAKKDGEDKTATEKARADAATAELATLKQAHTALQAKHDTLDAKEKGMAKCDECGGTGKVDGKKCEDCGGTGEIKMDDLRDFDKRTASRARSNAHAIATGAASRAALLAQAAPHLSSKENLDGKTNTEIKRMVLAKLGVKLEGKADEIDRAGDAYAIARFDSEMAQIAAKKVDPISRVRLVRGDDGAGENPPARDVDPAADDKNKFDGGNQVQYHNEVYRSRYIKNQNGK